MYNLTVEDAHTFAVGRGQWVVHNDCRPIYPDGEIPKPGTEHIVRVVNSSENFYESYGYARNLAKNFIGDLGDDAIDFVSSFGPMEGRVLGRQTADKSRGWRVDWDPNKGFHVNWWDYTGGNKRAQQTYGAVIVEGATYDNYLEILKHFPSN